MLIAATTAEVFKYIGMIVLAILILLVHILIHELGHYTAARLMKIKVKEFAVGFGPKLWSKVNKREEIVSVRAFPLGGFCAFFDEEIDGTTEHSFNKNHPKKRMLVLLFGGLFNIISAIIFAMIMLFAIGYAVPVIDKLYETPNAALLQKGDIILAVDGEELGVLKDYSTVAAKIPENQAFTLTVERNGQTVTITGLVKGKYTYTDSAGAEQNATGVGMTLGSTRRYLAWWQSILYAAPVTFQMAWQMLLALGGILTGAIGIRDSLTGPISTIKLMADVSAQNASNIWVLFPAIAISLGVFNLLPVPALDGSKMVFTGIEWIRGKPVNRNVEAYIHFAGLILLLGGVMVLDILNILSWV